MLYHDQDARRPNDDRRRLAIPDSIKCTKCQQWRCLKCEWPKGRVFDHSAVCLICDPSAKGVYENARRPKSRG